MEKEVLGIERVVPAVGGVQEGAAVAVGVETRIKAGSRANLDAQVGARNLIKPRSISAAYSYVFDRFGLHHHIGRVRAAGCNQRRRRPKEKRFYCTHVDPPID